jgi:hypothetical protein
LKTGKILFANLPIRVCVEADKKIRKNPILFLPRYFGKATPRVVVGKRMEMTGPASFDFPDRTNR